MTINILSRTDQADYLPDFSKITHPTIYDIATDYATSGVAEYVGEMLRPLPDRLQKPLIYTFANHVTKERPMSVVHIAEELGANREKALGIAACIDVLWNVGIVVDDIYDKDATNAGQLPSAWARFGKKTSFAAATAAVATTVAYAARRYGPGQALFMSRQLQQGVSSLTQSRAMPVDSSLERYYSNYDMRSGFYAIFPIGAVAKYAQASPRQVAGVQSALLRMNRGGQMINDLQDFDSSTTSSRAVAFSDIRNGVSSIPIRHLWLASSDKNRERLRELHGKGELSGTDAGFIRWLTAETGMGQAVVSLIKSEYSTAREEYIASVEPSSSTLAWVDAWLDYKREQAWNAYTALGAGGRQ
jgi:geranylgeranyl pyrophosphate synthase